MTNWPILSLMIFIPLFGAFIIALIDGEEKNIIKNSKMVALWTSMVVFVLSIFLWATFPSISGFHFVEEVNIFSSIGITYRLGIDGISMLFVFLSAFLVPICILASWKSIKIRVKEYMILFLILESLMIGTFSALDILLFYIFFEALLIPMFFIIGIWGGARKVYAAFKFFLYTLAGSVLFLLAIILMAYNSGTFDIRELLNYNFSNQLQMILWPALFISFAVKTPMWPFHTWLPDAHVEAPTAGSVILAGVLLKMGGYGFIRFSIGMLPEASKFFIPLIMILSIVAIIYTSLVALAQKDMKKLIAYSSVAHMGMVTIGIFLVNHQGLEGAMIQMISHGIVSAALFLCVGVIYDRMHTRDINFYGGLVNIMPKYSVALMIFVLASVGLPGTSGFIGEILVIIGSFKYSTTLAFFATTGIILSAVYMLYLYKNLIFGLLKNEKLKEILDLDLREKIILYPLIFVIIIIGIFPNIFLDPMRQSIDLIIINYEIANAK